MEPIEDDKKTRVEDRQEEKFRIIFDGAMDGVILADMETKKFTDANKAICQMLGYSREEMKKLGMEDIHPKESLPYVLGEVEKQMRGDISLAKDIPVKRRDGSIFYADVNSSEVVIDGKKYLMGVFRDITEKRQAEAEKEQYFKFFMLSTDPMCIADPFGNFKQVNPAFARLTGFSEKELISKPFMEFVVPEDRERTKHEMELQVKERPSLNFENRYMRKDGTVVLLSWTAYFDKTDGVTYATAEDITDQRRAEDALKESEARLKEAQRIARLGSWRWDPKLDASLWSKEVYETFGLDPSKPAPDIEGVKKLFTPASWELRKKLLDTLLQTGESYDAEFEYVRPDGKHGWLFERAEAVKNGTGRVVMVQGTRQDITALRTGMHKEDLSIPRARNI